jgi:hypothetical protein
MRQKEGAGKFTPLSTDRRDSRQIWCDEFPDGAYGSPSDWALLQEEEQ